MEALILQKGAYGPIRKFPSDGLKLSPLVLFLGKTGTGKSLVSKLVCHLRNFPFLVQLCIDFEEGAKENNIMATWNDLCREMSHFAQFASPSASFRYVSPLIPEGIEFELDKEKGVTFRGDIKSTIERLAEIKERYMGYALYIPAERTMIELHRDGRLTSEKIELSAPSVVLGSWYTALLEASIFLNSRTSQPGGDNEQWVRQRGIAALSGELTRVGNRWVWTNGDISIDAAIMSGGQKAGWPIVLLSTLLFPWRESGKIPRDFALHIEEPENGLHPNSQCEVVKILAYLVNHGFQVLVTTHSMTVLYALNNLIEASALPEDYTEPGIPEPEVRLKPGKVGGYFFREDGAVVDLVDKTIGVVSEAELAEVGESLVVEANRINYLIAYGR